MGKVDTLPSEGSGQEQGKGSGTGHREVVGGEIEAAERVFVRLMVLTAMILSLAHGSQDISNAVAPFSALVELGVTGEVNPAAVTPMWVLAAGGIGIVVGLATYGHKVMATVGEKIAKLTFSRGFAAQSATAATLLCATVLGMSVSTTHVLIGAIAGVALVEGPGKINNATLQKIGLSWVVTIPAAAGFSIAVFALWGAVAPMSVVFPGSGELLAADDDGVLPGSAGAS